jgi:type VI secretion system protein
MGREQTLLDRIAARSGHGRSRYQASAKEDLDALMESVRRQLARLLNARHGMSEALPEYGLPALTDLTVGSGDYVQRVLDAIQHTIASYEPRLRRVRVSRVADDERPHQSLRFRIDATLVGEDGQHRVWYETEFGGGGQFEVSD